MDLTMELGEEEKDEDFRIETTVVDNETLDLGPFHDDTPRQQEPPGTSTDVATMQLEDEDVGLYSVVDKSRKTSTRSGLQYPPQLIANMETLEEGDNNNDDNNNSSNNNDNNTNNNSNKGLHKLWGCLETNRRSSRGETGIQRN
nr:hypothetical protein BaRGS_001134 [Batillaria attramentaria]